MSDGDGGIDKAAILARRVDSLLHSGAYGDTPALRRTGVTDRQAAGVDPVTTPAPVVYDEVEDRYRDNVSRWNSNHADAYDADDYNRPRNGLGTYHETDAAW